MYIQGLHLSRRTRPSHPDASGYIRSAVQSQKAVTAYLTGQQLLPSDLAEQRCGRGRGVSGLDFVWACHSADIPDHVIGQKLDQEWPNVSVTLPHRSANHSASHLRRRANVVLMFGQR